MSQLLLAIIFFAATSHLVGAKWVSGRVHTQATWKFVSRFAFLDTGGKLEYSVEYPVTRDECCLQLVFYDDTIWPCVYPHKETGCVAKTGDAYQQIASQKVVLVRNQTTNTSIYSCRDKPNAGVRLCSGTLRFHSSRNRWWFFAFSNCNSTTGLELTYDFVFTNGDSWERHLSADELHILETNAAFLVGIVITFILALFSAKKMWIQDLLHRSYKLFLLSLCIELGAVLFDTGYYVEYVHSGRAVRAILDLGNLLDAAGDIIFAFLIILLAKGWTITRSRLCRQTQVKLAIFFTLYILSYGVLFIYDIQLFDPGLVMYIYDSPAGRGMVALRLVAWLWFNYAIYFSIKHYPEKTAFFVSFALSLGIWFLAKPALVFMGFYVIESWSRTKICTAVEMTICLVGHIMFLYLLRPSARNSSQPFHVCTTQVDLMPPTADPNFQHTEAFTRLHGKESGELETSLTELDKIAGTPTDSEAIGA